MRRAVDPDPEATILEIGRQERAGRALAVGAADMDAGEVAFGMAQDFEQQQLRARAPQLGTRHHGVHHAMLHQEFRRLEAGGQILADRLFDHAGAREADDGTRLRQNHVALHGVGRRHAARGGVGEQRNERDAVLGQLGQHHRRLGHLHQRGIFLSIERRARRAIFSPTTDPIEPPMKLKSITARSTGMPSSRA